MRSKIQCYISICGAIRHNSLLIHASNVELLQSVCLSTFRPFPFQPWCFNVHLTLTSLLHSSPATRGTCCDCCNTTLPESDPWVDFGSTHSLKDGWMRSLPPRRLKVHLSFLVKCELYTLCSVLRWDTQGRNISPPIKAHTASLL